MTLYKIADRLKKSVSEVCGFSRAELAGWVQYINDELERNAKDARD